MTLINKWESWMLSFVFCLFIINLYLVDQRHAKYQDGILCHLIHAKWHLFICFVNWCSNVHLTNEIMLWSVMQNKSQKYSHSLRHLLGYSRKQRLHSLRRLAAVGFPVRWTDNMAPVMVAHKQYETLDRLAPSRIHE